MYKAASEFGLEWGSAGAFKKWEVEEMVMSMATKGTNKGKEVYAAASEFSLEWGSTAGKKSLGGEGKVKSTSSNVNKGKQVNKTALERGAKGDTASREAAIAKNMSVLIDTHSHMCKLPACGLYVCLEEKQKQQQRKEGITFVADKRIKHACLDPETEHKFKNNLAQHM